MLKRLAAAETTKKLTFAGFSEPLDFRLFQQYRSKADFADMPSICQKSKAKLVDQQPAASTPMQKRPLDPSVADTAPSDSVLTVYDEEHVITYRRLLDADAQGADWREVAAS
jgi:hypothetical protein